MKNNYTVVKLICLIAAVLLFNTNLFSQQEEEKDVEDLLDFSLESIMDMKVVSGSRNEQKIIDSPRSISLITAQEIREKNYRTVPEALAELVGVHLQETNYGGGAVILRGLIGNQVLIMVDGVRLNNAIYRLGPNQYLNTIDINQVEQIEVVKGAGSVLYGSDALGGLVNIITKSKVKKSDGTDATVRAYSRYATADNGIMGRIELGKQLGDLNFYGGASLKKFNDLKGGSNTGTQIATGYSEWDADLKLNYTPSEQHNFTIGYQHVNQSDVPRSDVVISGADIKRDWDPELRDLAYFEYNFNNVASFIDNVNTKLSYQTQSESVYRIQSAKPNSESNNFDKVNTLGATLQLNSSINESQRFTYGVDMTFDKVTSTRTDLDLKTGATSVKVGNFANGSKYSTFALFLQDEIKLTESLFANVGLRYNSIKVEATIVDKSLGTVNVDLNKGALVGSGFLMYKFSEGFNVSFGVSQGFRAPNVDDATILASTGTSYEVPNPNLEPEKSMNYELGVKLSSSDISGTLSLYYSKINDLILRVPGIYAGKSYIDLNNNGTKDANEPSVLQRNNTGEATIYGVEWEGKYQISKEFDVNAQVSWLKGEDNTANTPLTRIPPLEGKFGAKWRVSNNLWVEYYNLFATKQDELSPSDKADKRIPVGGTPGYLTYNLRGGYDLGNYGRVTLGLENLTNASYRYHASGIDSPGFNLVFGYDIAF